MNYLEILLDGYINNNEFLANQYYRDCREAEIEPIEFFKRLSDQVDELEDYRDQQYAHFKARSTSDLTNFAPQLFHFTQRKRLYDDKYMGPFITDGMIEYLRNAIAEALNKSSSGGESDKSGNAQDILREAHFKKGQALDDDEIKVLAGDKSFNSWKKKYKNKPELWREKFDNELRQKRELK